MQTYTITGAADWQMLVTLVGFLGGGLGAVILGMIGMMWRDLSSKFDTITIANDKEHDEIWKAIEECQADCCPRGRKVDA